MAIYFPPLFCGIGTTLKAIKYFEIEFEAGETLKVSAGDKCVVEEIVGYGYNIKKDSNDVGFRILNSSMSEYFNIIDKVDPEPCLDVFDPKNQEIEVITLQKNFEIRNLVTISKGQQFNHIIDRRRDGIFHDLLSLDLKNKILRMSDNEFQKYFR
jgi:hypothetical protein